MKRGVLLVVAAFLAAGCQDLVVENTNSPDRNRALAQPDAIELLAASTYPGFYSQVYRDSDGYVPLSMTGDESTNSSNTAGGRDLSTLPRRAFDNNPVNDDQYELVEEYWGDIYEVFANATDALRVINSGVVIMTGNPAEDNTHRLRVFAKFAQGLASGYTGLLFDQAFIFDENTPEEVVEDPVQHGLGLVPYPEVIAHSVALLQEAIQIAGSGDDFVIPQDWLYTPADVSRSQLIEMAHAYAARYLALQARTGAERDNVDWQAVLDHASQVSSDVLVQLGSSSTGQNNSYLNRAHSTTSGSRWYAHPRLVGPADISGAYQTWLATPFTDRTRFLIETPDRRITGAGGPETDGKYFRFDDNNRINPLYGTYRESFYQFARYHSDNGNSATSGTFAVLPLRELKLYMAEAYIRMGDLQTGVDIINETRVANGELPPITVDGVPESADCVPRTEDGDCGSLMDALLYERLIELAWVDPIRTWADRRGFDALMTGTLLHLPIPYEQQRILDIPYYTFGGSGPGSAQ